MAVVDPGFGSQDQLQHLPCVPTPVDCSGLTCRVRLALAAGPLIMVGRCVGINSSQLKVQDFDIWLWNVCTRITLAPAVVQALTAPSDRRERLRIKSACPASLLSAAKLQLQLCKLLCCCNLQAVS